MACLEIRLLGPFDVTLDGTPATGFESDSTRALLALLATEPGRVWSRPIVAEMLWPERPPGAALSNLRHVLSVLRNVLADSSSDSRFVIADRNRISLASSTEVWVDSVEFEQLAATAADQDGSAAAWERAADLWRGPFLEDLSLRAGAEWEEWQTVTCELLRRRLAATLRALAGHHERAGDSARAIPFAQRLVDIDVYDERAHRQLMRLLAATGETARALSVFADLAKQLDADLATAPAVETAALAERIRAGMIPRGPGDLEIVYPDFLASTRSLAAEALFVGRDRELEWLGTHLEAALAGHGRLVLISGEAGSGKTMLTAEFARRALARSDLLVARGRCNAYGGLGDPYLPFREVLGLLSGDVESAFAAGTIGREQATRLWETIPQTGRLLWERGPSLVGVMVNGSQLLERGRQSVPGAEWLVGLQERVDATASLPPMPVRMQPALFDEYTAVLAGLTAGHTIVLVLDDLQWGDDGSIALLWHLSRRLEGQRLLIVGAYRPEEIGPDHPLQQLLSELQGDLPDGTVELGSDRGFVDAYLDSEPNRLDADFRERLFSYTDGHPLLTVEMVRGMQERAEIRRNRGGLWVTQETLDWERIPTRVEAVIAQRVGRLPAELQDDLAIAAVQGEAFVAEAVAAVRKDDGVAERLRIESRSPHRLIEPAGAFRIDDRLVTTYRFRHILFQRYLYDRLGEAERLHLHEFTGRALEHLYRESADPPVVDLAYHFDGAQLAEPAIAYYAQAGQRAIRMAANEEAIRLLQRAVELLETLPESPQCDQRELEIRAPLAGAIMAVRGYSAPEAEANGRRLRQLCDRLQPSLPVGLALSGQAYVASVQASYAAMESISREQLSLADELDNSAFRLLGLFGCGVASTWAGRLSAGHEDLQQANEIFDPEEHGWLVAVFGQAAGPEASAWGAFNTLYRGYPDQAVRQADEAMTLARRLGPAFTVCHTVCVAGSLLRLCRGDYRDALAFVDEFSEIAATEHFPFFEVATEVHRGVALGHLGDPDAGVELIAAGLEQWRQMGITSYRALFVTHQAEFERRAGRPENGLQLLEAEASVAEAGEERLSAVYLAAQRGALLHAVGDERAEDGLRIALQDARAIGSPAIELSAATDLALLLDNQGRNEEAHSVLEPVYGWFTEGFDTPHLVRAKQVLERVAR